MSEEDSAQSALLDLIRVTKNLRQECSKLRSLNEDLRSRMNEAEKQKVALEREKQGMSEKLCELKDRIDKLSGKEESRGEVGCLEKEEQKKEEQATVDDDGATEIPAAAEDEAASSEQIIIEATKSQRIPMDERRRFLIRVIQLIRYTFRGYFGDSFANKWGFFVDRNMSTEIHSFADWVAYPKGDHELEGHSDQVNCAVITRDGCYLFTGSEDGVIVKWDLRSNEIITRFEAYNCAVKSVAHYTGVLVSGSSDGKIKVWNDEEDYSLIRTMEGHTRGVRSVSLFKRGTMLVSGSTDTTCRLWSVKNGECLRVIRGHTRVVSTLLSANDMILTGSWDKSIRIWDTESGKQLSKITKGIGAAIYDLSLNCDSSTLAVCHSRGFTLFQYPSMEVMSTIEMITLSSDFHPWIPSILAVSDNHTHSIRVYSTDTSKCIIHTLNGHTDYIAALQFSPDGHRLISGAKDKSVRVWDVSELN